MNFEQLASQMSAEMYGQLKTAVEIGRWPDGRALSAEQRQISLQAILQYEIEHLPPEQRTGYIPPKNASSCGANKHQLASDQTQTLKWQS